VCICRLMQCAYLIFLSVACPSLPCFSTVSHERHDFRKRHDTCVFIFLTIFVRNISHSKNNSAKYHKCTQVFMSRARYSCQILIKLEFPRHIFEKFSNIKFHENPFNGRWIVPCGWTDIQTDMTKLIVAVLRTRLIRMSERCCLTDHTNGDK